MTFMFIFPCIPFFKIISLHKKVVELSFRIRKRGEIESTTNACSRRIKLIKEDIEREFAAQIGKFLSAKLTPTHIDTHQYIHMFKKVCKAAIKTARKYRINKMRYLYEKQSPGFVFKYYKKPYIKSLIVSSFSKKSKNIFKKEKFTTPDNFTVTLFFADSSSKVINFNL